MMAERKKEDEEYFRAKKEEDDVEAAFANTRNRKDEMIAKKDALVTRIAGYEK